MERPLIFATHGHHFNTQHPPLLQPGDILLHGHTHIPADETCGNNNRYWNPGSISLPKGGSARSYMVLDEKGPLWRELK